MDLADYVSSSDRNQWRPALYPPALGPMNAKAEGDVHIHQGQYNVRTIDGSLWATQTVSIRGTFYEAFELESYPFDVQPLKVVLQSVRPGPNTFSFKGDPHKSDDEPGTASFLQSTEWATIGKVKSNYIFKAEHTGVERGRNEMTLEVIVKRHYTVHLWRVVAVMAFFALTSIGAFCLDQDDDAADRMAHVLTLMLTATAYSLVVANALPTLGYLTLLDQYILFIFAFLGTVMAEVIAVQSIESVQDVDAYIAAIDVGLWVISHAAFFV